MISVTCAVIRNEEEDVLIVQRAASTDHPLKWEFPGGKIKPGETEEECIIREVKEELSMEIVICGHLPHVEYDYGHKQIKLIPFICDTLDELPFLSEHIDYRWLQSVDLVSVDFSEADVIVANSYRLKVKTDKKPDKRIISDPNMSTIDDEELKSMVNNMMSTKEAEWIADSAIDNTAIFMKLLDYSYSSDKKLAFHSSWALTKVFDKCPALIDPYIERIIETLDKLYFESAKRSFLRIISLSDINKISYRHHGILAEHCFNELRSGVSAIAIKTYSMEILYKLALIYPELANELSASINMIMGEASGGIRARGYLILKKLI